MLKPKLLILVEGEFWFNLMREVKKIGGSIALTSGRVSKKSMKYYLLFPTFSRSLFEKIDHFLLQSKIHTSRFLNLGVPIEKIIVTGNLKFDIATSTPKDSSILQQTLNLRKEDLVITLASTHNREEELLIQALLPLQHTYPHLKLLIAPRHTQRFAKVKQLVANYSHVIVIDKMGILSQCYQISDLAIVGGSFVKDVGGHDIFEPIKAGTPTLFGPFMHKQEDLVELVTNSGSGKMVSLDELLSTVQELFSRRQQLITMQKKGTQLTTQVMGSALRTWQHLNSLCNTPRP